MSQGRENTRKCSMAASGTHTCDEDDLLLVVRHVLVVWIVSRRLLRSYDVNGFASGDHSPQ